MPTALEPKLFDEVEEGLKDVVDPELGVNIVDLGLVYDLAWDEESDALIISMTLTSAGCPLTDVIEESIANSLDGIVEQFRINWVWMPPWGPERITDDGRDMMRALGFSISEPSGLSVTNAPPTGGWASASESPVGSQCPTLRRQAARIQHLTVQWTVNSERSADRRWGFSI